MRTQSVRCHGARIAAGLVLSAAFAGAPPQSAAAASVAAFDVLGKSVTELADAQSQGRVSSPQLVDAYLKRIGRLDRAGPALHSVLAINPEARAQARALDRERAAGRVRGPLHGIPLLIKDNIETADPVPTTAGSLLQVLIVPTMGPAFLIDPINGDSFSWSGPGNLPAIAGYPHLTVPMGLVKGLPVGLSVMGPAWSDGTVLALGGAIEHLLGPLPPPTYAPKLVRLNSSR